MVTIPEYKCCAAMIERVDAPPMTVQSGANFTADSARAMFPYQVAQPAARPVEEGAH